MYARFALFALLGLSGCGSILSETTSTLSGVAGAAAGSAVSHNAAVASAIGLGFDSAAREGLNYVERRVHRYEQDRIAQAAGPLPVNAVGNWAVRHDLPLEPDNHGQVVVSREFGGLGFPCKEIVFSVDETSKKGLERAFYTATICRDGNVWRWATAEPSTSRWSGLQ